jgi:hypothetical protein
LRSLEPDFIPASGRSCGHLVTIKAGIFAAAGRPGSRQIDATFTAMTVERQETVAQSSRIGADIQAVGALYYSNNSLILL